MPLVAAGSSAKAAGAARRKLAPIALIVASAEQVEAAHILSEDLDAGQIIAGIEIVNPLIED